MQLHLAMTLFFVTSLTVLQNCLRHAEAASTERPYQFGFTIEKQQHRQEKKDERGIVMGEFGFITADGIYHVTVYATDEEGKFRILAMRSYPYEEHPKTIDMIVRPKAKPPATPKAIAPPPNTTTERAKPKPFEKHNFSVQGCSGCFIKNNVPTTTTAATTQKPADKKYEIRPLSKPLSPEGIVPIETQNDIGTLVLKTSNENPTENTQKAQATTENTQEIPQNIQETTPNTQATQSSLHNLPLNIQTILKTTTSTPFVSHSTDTYQSSPPTVVLNEAIPVRPGNAINKNTAKTQTAGAFGSANVPKAPGKSGANAPSSGSTGATSGFATPKKELTAPAVSAGNTGGTTTDGGANRPNTNTRLGGGSSNSGSNGQGGNGGQSSSGGNRGNKDGSSGGLSGDMRGSSTGSETGDLYRFKYILDYNGHRETGAHNGNKEGSFYAIGDDNVERTIEYIANEFGYQPRVRFRKLDAPVQSKENTLKDYEFVWFKKE